MACARIPARCRLIADRKTNLRSDVHALTAISFCAEIDIVTQKLTIVRLTRAWRAAFRLVLVGLQTRVSSGRQQDLGRGHGDSREVRGALWRGRPDSPFL